MKLPNWLPRISWGKPPGAKSVRDPTDQTSGSFGWETVWGAPTIWNSIGRGFFSMSTTELENAYGDHPAVMSCTNLLADTSVIARLEVGMWRNNEWEALSGHPALDLLLMPNREDSPGEFLRKIVKHMCL